MSHLSAPELLVLHALRVKGMADAATVTERFDLDRELVDELLLDHEAFGWDQSCPVRRYRGMGIDNAWSSRG